MEFEIAYTDKAITPWGGMVLLRQMLDKMNFSQVIESCDDLPQPGSNRGYKPLAIIESSMTSIWCGANKFLHTEIARHDQTLCKIFGWIQMPGNDAIKRFFGKFDQAKSQRVSDHFYKWIFSNLKFDNLTLDYDTNTLWGTTGSQEGILSS